MLMYNSRKKLVFSFSFSEIRIFLILIIPSRNRTLWVLPKAVCVSPAPLHAQRLALLVLNVFVKLMDDVIMKEQSFPISHLSVSP